jgi:uncharacterized damage-inducible protein DinB
MVTAEQLVEAYGRNLGIVKRQVQGLTHADSVLQLPFRGNCLNWVLGHIADSRNTVLKALGAEPVLTEAQAKRYGYGSAPVTCDGEDIMRLEELLAALELSQERLETALARATPEELAREADFAGGTMKVGQQVFFLYFHDTYHAGQTELLRQLAGTDDKVI